MNTKYSFSVSYSNKEHEKYQSISWTCTWTILRYENNSTLLYCNKSMPFVAFCKMLFDQKSYSE